MNTFATTRAAEARRFTILAALVCGLGCLAALVPAVEHATNLAVGAAVALVLAVLAVRLLARRLRERREDRADARTAARWRAVHAPHLLDADDRARLATPPATAGSGAVAVAVTTVGRS
jgi:hypothetical protein